MDINLIINDLKNHIGVTSDLELADYFGVGNSAISNWRNRKRLPINKILAKNSELNHNWLLTGEGPMLRVDSSDSAIRKRIKDLKEMYRMPNDVFTKKTGLNVDFFYDYNKKYVVNNEILEKIKTVFKDVNETWLLTGEGPMVKEVLSDEERQGYEKRIKELESIIDDKNTIIAMLKEKLEQNKKINKAAS